MHHIAILVYKDDSLDDAPYYLNKIVKIWENDGIRITIHRGPEHPVNADLAILHVNLTVVPADHLAAVRQYPLVINGEVTDISKRRISNRILNKNDGYGGPVIVKTDRNNGGKREGYSASRGPLIPRYLSAARRRLPWTLKAELGESDYRVFEKISNVPRIVWSNPNLVVERFVSEMRDGLYGLRTWTFFGDKEFNKIG